MENDLVGIPAVGSDQTTRRMEKRDKAIGRRWVGFMGLRNIAAGARFYLSLRKALEADKAEDQAVGHRWLGLLLFGTALFLSCGGLIL